MVTIWWLQNNYNDALSGVSESELVFPLGRTSLSCHAERLSILQLRASYYKFDPRDLPVHCKFKKGI